MSERSEKMNETKLTCGHLFFWKVGEPKGKVFCYRCDDYSETEYDAERKRPFRKRMTSEERSAKVSTAKALFIKGLSVPEIAEEMGFSRSTIQTWLGE